MAKDKSFKWGPPPVVLSIGAQTREAVATLLAIADKIGPYCVTAAETGSIPGTGEKTMEEAADSAETTFMKACAALDDIISDKSRWANEGEKGLQEALKGMHEERARNLAAHTAAMEKTVRPCFLLRPLMLQLRSGLWVCATGTENGALQGHGRSPEEAHKSFDEAYHKLQSEAPLEELVQKTRQQAEQSYQDQQPQPKPAKGRKKGKSSE